MPDLSAFGGYPSPTGPEAADVPADLLALVSALDAHTVLFATSVSDRNAKYGSVPAGALVTCPGLKTIWLALGSGVWSTVYSDSGWSTAGFTWSAGFSDSASRWRQVGPLVEVDLHATYSGADIVASSVGGVSDVSVVTVGAPPPVASRPAIFRTSLTSGSGYLSSTGLISLSDLHSLSTLSAGHSVAATFVYMV